MQDIQNIPNPDVNSTGFDDDFGSHESVPKRQDAKAKARRPDADEHIPIPNEALPVYPVEKQTGRNNQPLGDVDDSPKRIAWE